MKAALREEAAAWEARFHVFNNIWEHVFIYNSAVKFVVKNV